MKLAEFNRIVACFKDDKTVVILAGGHGYELAAVRDGGDGLLFLVGERPVVPRLTAEEAEEFRAGAEDNVCCHRGIDWEQRAKEAGGNGS